MYVCIRIQGSKNGTSSENSREKLYLFIVSEKYKNMNLLDYWVKNTVKCRALIELLLSRFRRVRLCATPLTAPHQSPWNSPGKNTRVGCHFLLQCMKVKCESEVTQSCPTQRSHGLQPTRLLHPWDFSRQEYWSGSPLPSPLIELRHIKFINSYKRKLKIFIVKAKKAT